MELNLCQDAIWLLMRKLGLTYEQAAELTLEEIDLLLMEREDANESDQPPTAE